MLGGGSVPNVVFQRLFALLGSSCSQTRTETHSNIMEGFQPAVSGMGTPPDMGS